MEGISETEMEATNVHFDTKCAIAMGSSYHDTKHTRHIMRPYHMSEKELHPTGLQQNGLQQLHYLQT
jgi:hypothetical protein